MLYDPCMSLWSRVQRRLGDLAGELVLDEYRDQLNTAQDLMTAAPSTVADAQLAELHVRVVLPVKS